MHARGDTRRRAPGRNGEEQGRARKRESAVARCYRTQALRPRREQDGGKIVAGAAVCALNPIARPSHPPTSANAPASHRKSFFGINVPAAAGCELVRRYLRHRRARQAAERRWFARPRSAQGSRYRARPSSRDSQPQKSHRRVTRPPTTGPQIAAPRPTAGSLKPPARPRHTRQPGKRASAARAPNPTAIAEAEDEARSASVRKACSDCVPLLSQVR